MVCHKSQRGTKGPTPDGRSPRPERTPPQAVLAVLAVLAVRQAYRK
jgi:hypothetical protein